MLKLNYMSTLFVGIDVSSKTNAVYAMDFEENKYISSSFGNNQPGIIGANRSPNCGVETTSDFNKEISGKGVFMSELSNRINALNLNIPMLGIKNTDNIFNQLKSIIK